VLTDRGYSVLEAGDAHSGLRVLKSASRVDLLVTDIGLPGGMNGRQLAEAAQQGHPSLKVLFITGYANGVAVSNLQDQSMQVITKPFAMESLVSKVQTILAG
jgi:DNA-binding NtrC family response regulator